MRMTYNLLSDTYFTALYTMPKLSFFHNLHILFIFLLLELSASIRQGENGRYLYNDDLGFERYCHYCPPVAMYDSENNVLYQEPRCFEKNYPFHLKCDQEELERKLLPVCRYGTLPSCFLHKMPEDGYWNCTSSFFHNKTSDGYHIPVYTMCQLTCEQGFSPTGISNIYCRENRHWDLNPNTVACQKSVSADEPGHRKVDRRERKKLLQILRLEKKLVNLKIAMLSEHKRQNINNILLR
ncbi:hypothetical protein CHS0354_026087 [Potamilus streckersoni]|uniref:Sushi domain-containing protein n=1 Tax=Potamilus streckersoni TaxID=2493646 RepID=A0AAE0SIM8_9BIVA|nr:hypothetical protein CHS0354_026087 [Potamilus streckersoni]